MKKSSKFNKSYFFSNLYGGVNFEKKFTMYWWSCRFYANLIRKYCRQGKLLDIGCGLGHLLKNLESDFQTTGIDINKWAVTRAKINSPQSTFFVLRAEKVDKINDKFDVVVMRHLIEHLDNPGMVISSCRKILNKNGLLLLATPNPENIMAKLKGKDWVGFKDPTHVSIKKPKEWFSILKSNKFLVGLKTSDGFWAAPYIPIVPSILQKPFFGFLGGIQAVTNIVFLPVNFGEDLIVIAREDG